MSTIKPTMGSVLHAFFEDHLKAQRALSSATVKSYRDALRLYLIFVATQSRRKITRLSLSELTAERVLSFLHYLEAERHNHIRSRNQRLSAIKTFFNYMAALVPEMLIEAERVTAIPVKRAPPAQTIFLTSDQLNKLFAHLPKAGHFALRDRTLLLFLYNTGARVQEVADLRVGNLEVKSRSRVHLHGKGDKWRVCPLWKETIALLEQLLAQSGTANADSPVFVSLHGGALTRFGIYKIVRKHTQHLSTCQPQGISPHCIRHATAVNLLESGVDVNVIRAWLGHVSLETTNRYAEISLRMKAEALKTCEAPVSTTEGLPGKARWKDDPSLLKWLESL